MHEKYARINRIAGWAAMGAAGIFAVVSMSFHDYRLGEAVEGGEKVERFQKAACAEQAEREVAELVKAICRHAPKGAGEKIRKEFGRAR